MEDDKEALHMAIRKNDIIEYTENEFSSAKRARLDVNYQIGPAGVFKQHHHQHHHSQNKHHHQIDNQHHHSQMQQSQQQHQTSVHHSRRKMHLVNRIA